MAKRPVHSLLSFIRRVAAARAGRELTDRQLVERFVATRDQAAFEVIVRRYGRMVWGVCQRVLRNPHDADDAFQATFLVLVRKVGSIGKREALAGWLCGVAYRVALKARAAAALRRAGGGELIEPTAPAETSSLESCELRTILDEEIDRLPMKYRMPVILCYLEGKTYTEAAQQLGWAEGTVSGRLARARKLLHQRLSRRGVSCSSVGVAAALSATGASAAVPIETVVGAVHTALSFTVGPMTGSATVPAVVLAEGVLQTMLLTKVKVIAAVGLTLGILGAASLLTSRTTAVEIAREAKTLARSPSARPIAQPVPKQKSDREKLQGSWSIVSGIHDGRPFEKDHGFVRKLTIAGDRAQWLLYDRLFQDGVLKLDPNANPKTLDLSFNVKLLNWVGIYRFEDDRLTICLRNLYSKDQRRPSDFSGEKGTNCYRIVLKKEPDGDKKKENELQMARQISNGRLMTLAVAMHEYYEKHNSFPPPTLSSKDGKPLLSWRVALLPELGLNELYQQFKLDEPWDSPANKALLSKMPKVYTPVAGKTKEPYSTYYQVFVGKGAAFEEGRAVPPQDFDDGTSATLLIVEAREAVPWTKPSDLSFDPNKALPELGGVPDDGLFSFAMADGSTLTLSRNSEEAFLRILHSLITRSGSEHVDYKELSKWRK